MLSVTGAAGAHADLASSISANSAMNSGSAGNSQRARNPGLVTLLTFSSVIVASVLPRPAPCHAREHPGPRAGAMSLQPP